MNGWYRLFSVFDDSSFSLIDVNFTIIIFCFPSLCWYIGDVHLCNFLFIFRSWKYFNFSLDVSEAAILSFNKNRVIIEKDYFIEDIKWLRNCNVLIKPKSCVLLSHQSIWQVKSVIILKISILRACRHE